MKIKTCIQNTLAVGKLLAWRQRENGAMSQTTATWYARRKKLTGIFKTTQERRGSALKATEELEKEISKFAMLIHKISVDIKPVKEVFGNP